MDRVIYHCDCNSFYCSVELLSHPELKAVPTAVCGDPKSRHGIIPRITYIPFCRHRNRYRFRCH